MEQKTELRATRRSSLEVIGDACLTVEKVRIRAEIRLAHLARRGEVCPDTVKILEAAKQFEAFTDGMLAERITQHPVWPFVSRVKGCGKENVAKVIARIEKFGRFYDVGDPQIPSYVTRPPEEYPYLNENDEIAYKTGVWVEGIERLTMPSKLRKLAGHAPGMRKEKGRKVLYDQTLKMLVWRLGVSLLRAGGKFYHMGYEDYRVQLDARFASQGIKVVPTPKGRMCFECNKEVSLKAALYCPDCGEPLSLKKEPEGIIYKGHVHNLAALRMRQRFLDALWAAWREAVGLPVVTPYVQSHLQHEDIIPWQSWMDR